MRETIIASIFCCSLAFAESDMGATTMSPIDAAQLDAAVTHVNLITTQAEQQKRDIDARANEAAKPYFDTVNAVCARYGIDPHQLGKIVSVDVASGKITRTPAPKTSTKK